MKYYEEKYLDWGYDLDGMTLEQARDHMEALSKVYGKEAKLVFKQFYESVDFGIMVERAETAEEKKARLEKEKKQEEKDRKKFEAMKAKYGWE